MRSHERIVYFFHRWDGNCGYWWSRLLVLDYSSLIKINCNYGNKGIMSARCGDYVGMRESRWRDPFIADVFCRYRLFQTGKRFFSRNLSFRHLFCTIIFLFLTISIWSTFQFYFQSFTTFPTSKDLFFNDSILHFTNFVPSTFHS